MQCYFTFGPIPGIFQPCSGNHIQLIESLRVAPVNPEIDERPGPVNGDRIRMVPAALAVLTCYVSSGLETSSRLGDPFAESTLLTEVRQTCVLHGTFSQCQLEFDAALAGKQVFIECF
jgi:hypothetical protein